jgi:SAM-dependent methyltransferase
MRRDTSNHRGRLLNRFQAIDPALLRLRAGARVLDVGCGIGRHVLETARVPGVHVGVDLAREDLRKARYWRDLIRKKEGLPGGVSFLEATAERLPFGDGIFDHVVCTEVLEHVPDDRAVLGELLRVLRPGGTIAVSVPDEYSERILWRLSKRYRTAPGGHVRIYRRRQIVALLRDAGVRVDAVRYRHALEAFYWVFGALIARDRVDHPVVLQLRRVLSTMRPTYSAILDRIDAVGNYVFPKSIVVYGRKVGQG